MAQHKAQRVRVERADIDIIAKKRVDDAARREQWPDTALVKPVAALLIIRQQVGPKRIIAGMGFFARLSEPAAKRVLQRAKFRIFPDDEAGVVDRPPADRRSERNGRCDRGRAGGGKGKGESAQEGARESR